MFRIALIFLSLIFSFAAQGQVLGTSGSGLGGTMLGTPAAQTKSLGTVVEKQSVVRVVDQELGIVCYVAHGISFEAGVAMQCMALPKASAE